MVTYRHDPRGILAAAAAWRHHLELVTELVQNHPELELAAERNDRRGALVREAVDEMERTPEEEAPDE